MTARGWDAEEFDEQDPDDGTEERSVFDQLFDDPYEELDEEFTEDEEEHPLSTRQTRRRRNFRPDDE